MNEQQLRDLAAEIGKSDARLGSFLLALLDYVASASAQAANPVQEAQQLLKAVQSTVKGG